MSRHQPRPAATPTDPLETALANAVKRFRKLGNLHDASADSAIVRYAFGVGKDLIGAEGIRAAAIALETAARATIDPREASGQEPGGGRGAAVEVRSELLS
jgi:hypothetical protein